MVLGVNNCTQLKWLIAIYSNALGLYGDTVPKDFNCSLLTITEFFISATALSNSLKCSSGVYGIGKVRSPDAIPALRTASSVCWQLVMMAAWYTPVEMPCTYIYIQ